ncbi:MAG: DUF5990 family protein [Pyrinomonadaceae bacterium]
MRQQVGIRIRVLMPPEGVAMQVQRGKYELLPAVSSSEKELVFEFQIEVDLTAAEPNFLGKYAQGPKDARFVYVNSGAYAGDATSGSGRRAKLSLMSITKVQIEQALASRWAKLETSFNGTARDGGATCASVKGLEWRVVGE